MAPMVSYLLANNANKTVDQKLTNLIDIATIVVGFESALLNQKIVNHKDPMATDC